MILTSRRIEPLSALMFDFARCAPISGVMAPPYDLIDQTRQLELYARSPYNVVRLELNRESDPYAAAARTLSQWLAEGILIRVPRPAIYLYTQVFEINGRRLERGGIVVRIRLEDFKQGRILPHERTFPAAKEDRLRLLTATRVNISPIFGLYPSGSQALETLLAEVRDRAPLLEVRDDLGIVNQIRPIDTSGELQVIQGALDDARILIADGHHRYETALEYRRRRRSGNNPEVLSGDDYVMMTLVAFNDPGLVILPTHRVVRHVNADALAAFTRRMGDSFEVEEFDAPETMRNTLAHRGRGYLGLALRGDPVFRIVRLKNRAEVTNALPSTPRAVRELDVSILHAMIFDRMLGLTADEIRKGGNLEYTIEAGRALDSVVRGVADGAFLMNPPTVEDVERVSASDAVMPEKSTYFYPKLLTGLLLNPLDDAS